MIDKPIYLPNRQHYQLEEVARAIADIFPDKPNDAKGIDCLSKKVLAPPRLRFESGSASRPLYLYVAKSFSQKANLTKEDREKLGSMLPRLPQISHFMSDSDIELFFEKYYELQNRPTWEPDITSPAARQMMKEDYDTRVKKHCDYYLSKIATGIFSAFDERLTMLSGMECNAQKIALITKKDAIAYLNLLNLAVVFKDIINSNNSILDREIIDQENLNISHSFLKIDSKIPKIRREKRDSLTQAIEDFQKEFPNNWTPLSMWNHFIKMANMREPPFTRLVDDRIYWKDSKNSRGINLKALDARLRRQEKKLKKPNSEAACDNKTN